MRIIYYYPAPIKEHANSASSIRPKKMLDAFLNLGYEVDVVSGYTVARKKCIEKVKENVKRGVKYDFAYGEDTTLPFAMNDPSHIPTSPFMDYSFWAWMKSKEIPFGCFYRDMYWRFPEFRRDLAFYKWAAPLPFHYCDVLMLKKYCKKIFFPSVECAKDLPFNIPDSMVAALPPGCELFEISVDNAFTSERPLRLFYVGGILPPAYDISPLIDYMNESNPSVSLTICCRKFEYEKAISNNLYNNLKSAPINIIHNEGEDICTYWNTAQIFIIARKNVRYLNNAMPFKLFEAIGHGLPILITKGGAAAQFVEQNNLGWVIEPKKENLKDLLSSIIIHPEYLKEKRSISSNMRQQHSWKARARYVEKALT